MQINPKLRGKLPQVNPPQSFRTPDDAIRGTGIHSPRQPRAPELKSIIPLVGMSCGIKPKDWLIAPRLTGARFPREIINHWKQTIMRNSGD